MTNLWVRRQLSQGAQLLGVVVAGLVQALNGLHILFERGYAFDGFGRHDHHAPLPREPLGRVKLAHPDQVGTAELKALIARLIHDIDEVW
ncbi:hypothetical protein CQR50_0235 [Bifidobacterium pseudolongum subsp. globosum]|uniref:Uncharacterized protein n=1 Tax=Bifidobacterium pseudolongum subsp. globosum TaxID=1690 RepID=A0A2N3R6L0_9BIFI|nr:hypothetical protein CQR50_0235 [Bifidobacterium pseudolongum subsp. globosum]